MCGPQCWDYRAVSGEEYLAEYGKVGCKNSSLNYSVCVWWHCGMAEIVKTPCREMERGKDRERRI